MAAIPQIGRKLRYKRQERRFLHQAVKQSLYGSVRPRVERPFYETATLEEWSKAFLEWAESHRDLPQLPSQSYDRAYFYEDCR